MDSLTPLFSRWRLIVLACLLPLLWLLIDVAFNRLGANPIQALHIRLGDWTLRFLCITLAVTPVQTVTNWRGLADYRQLFGLYTFFYGSLHLGVYLLVDHMLVWGNIGMDILQSSYIWFGLLAYLVLFLLAITTSKFAKKRMGKSWKKLHRYIYLASIAAVLHYFWQLKGNLSQPVFYALLIFLLLSFRVLVWFKDKAFRRLMIPKPRQ